MEKEHDRIGDIDGAVAVGVAALETEAHSLGKERLITRQAVVGGGGAWLEEFDLRAAVGTAPGADVSGLRA